jgi:hypothetical protein
LLFNYTLVVAFGSIGKATGSIVVVASGAGSTPLTACIVAWLLIAVGLIGVGVNWLDVSIIGGGVDSGIGVCIWVVDGGIEASLEGLGIIGVCAGLIGRCRLFCIVALK